MHELEEKLIVKIAALNSAVWEHRVGRPLINEWIKNFENSKSQDVRSKERIHALYLLSQFIYFGSRQIRELLKSLYRDHYKYPIIAAIRRQHSDTTNLSLINSEFRKQLELTRFLGIGNPSESGSHLLYFFRQENILNKSLFINGYELFSRGDKKHQRTLRMPKVQRYVFIDDFCGSGDQGVEYSNDVLTELKRCDKNVKASYLVLFGTSGGLEKLRRETLFDDVSCVVELDETFKCFGKTSRYFSANAQSINKSFAERMCRRYGGELRPAHPLGYNDCQLLLGFHHNTPDNTLPIMWCDDGENISWFPVFKRYPKLYGGLLT